MTNAPSLDALLAAQIAAEDAVLAQGLEVWSVADPATGEVVLHLTPNDLIAPKPNSAAGASKAIRLVGAIPTGAANTAA